LSGRVLPEQAAVADAAREGWRRCGSIKRVAIAVGEGSASVPVELAQAIREGKVAMVHGRGGELLIAHDELERARREGVGA